MIERTFIFLPGISYKKERKLWHDNILTWTDFLNADLKIKNKELLDNKIIEAQHNLYINNASYFSNLLPLKDNWRLYNAFKDEAIYIDIECVGKKIILIGIYDNFDYFPFMLGYNFDKSKIKQKLLSAKLIVTFNGVSFDIPRISKLLSVDLKNIPIFDLRFSLQSFNITGTLKEIEERFNINRKKNLRNVNVFYLWNNFIYNHQKEALQRLINYNFEDVYNLKTLAEKSYHLLEESTFFKYKKKEK